MSEILNQALSEKVIGLAINVHCSLGAGLLEKCYVNAMTVELSEAGIVYAQQKEYFVYHKGIVVGQYFADLVVDNIIILEIKSCKDLNLVMEAQLINYLRISGIEVGYLLNFNSRLLQMQRRVYQRR